MKKLDFNVPFTPFCGLTFISCFNSAFIYLQKPEYSEKGFYCAKKDGKPCSGCNNCRNTPEGVCEKYFMLFDTICGRSALRCRYDGTPTYSEKMICRDNFYDGGTDDNIDFLFGFTGYSYEKVTEKNLFSDVIKKSIDAEKPVIARVLDDGYRVLTGYNENGFMCPDYSSSQQKPGHAPEINEIEALYVFGAKTAPRYTLKDGFDRILSVMECNIRENVWDGFTEKMGIYTSDSLRAASPDEKKARMARVAETMWHTFNCHNFAEVFRNRASLGVLAGNEFDEPCRVISMSNGYTHDLAWALIGIEQQASWDRHFSDYYGEMIELTLSRIKQNDLDVYASVKKIRDLL